MNPRVVSLVPSWTETLVNSGVNVVGRTRFCIHPAESVADIPTVGGTKDPRLDKIAALHADYVVVDREENTREFAASCPVPVIDTWVRSLRDCSADCERMAERLQSPRLAEIAKRWRRIDEQPVRASSGDMAASVPFVREWVRQPRDPGAVAQVLYLIWHDPWMTVAPSTFVGSVLNKVGLKQSVIGRDGRVVIACDGCPEPRVGDGDDLPDYPTVDLMQLDPKQTLLLGSTEPFPFHRKTGLLAETKFPAAIVDGENYSWFGERTLLALESLFS